MVLITYTFLYLILNLYRIEKCLTIKEICMPLQTILKDIFSAG